MESADSSLFIRPAVSAPRQITLRLNVLWSLTGNVAYAICQLGILVVLAKLGTHEAVLDDEGLRRRWSAAALAGRDRFIAEQIGIYKNLFRPARTGALTAVAAC